ncbi:MAG TPA: peptidoglycan-binding domain-containing protein [Bryobacteraceae bacterium]|nr:peptidoglycan-binding domain-containing protein [Bryobacteraceae bacterium]
MRTMIFGLAITIALLVGPSLLAQGSDDIRAEQQALKDKGLDPGPVDGINGPRTRAALREFQNKQNLKEDGRLGPQTRDALGLRPGSAGTDMKEAGTNLKTGYGQGGKDIGHGSKDMAHDVAGGHPIDGAKDIGKGVGHGAEKMGVATGHATKNAAKGVKNAVTGDHKDTKP